VGTVGWDAASARICESHGRAGLTFNLPGLKWYVLVTLWFILEELSPRIFAVGPLELDRANLSLGCLILNGEEEVVLVARPSGKICWNSFSASVAASFALHLPDFTFSSMYSRIDLSLHLSYSDWVILESRIIGTIANLFVHKEDLSVD